MPLSWSADGLSTHLRGRLATIRSAIDDIESATDPSPESLHNLHRDLRRLWVESGLWHALLAEARQEESLAIRQRIRRLSRLVGEVRDFDVGIQLVAGAATAPSSRETSVMLVGAQHRMQDDARLGRELLRAYIRTERDSGLYDAVERLVSEPLPGRPVHRLEQMVDRQGRRYDRRVRRSFRRARAHPQLRRLHRLRGRLRQDRYFREMLAALARSKNTGVPRRLARLENELGGLNDLAVLGRHVKRQGPEVQDAVWADELRQKLRERRRNAVHDLGRRRTRVAVRSLSDRA
jgi:CHAD domain-containing protein